MQRPAGLCFCRAACLQRLGSQGPVRVGSRTSKEPRKTGRSKLRVVRPLQQRRIRVTVTSLPPGPSFFSKVYQRKAAQRVLDNDQNRQKVTFHDIFGQIRANKNIRILYGQTKGFLGHNINYTVPSHPRSRDQTGCSAGRFSSVARRTSQSQGRTRRLSNSFRSGSPKAYLSRKGVPSNFLMFLICFPRTKRDKRGLQKETRDQ